MMIPFKITTASRRANASPSVSLEKGAYRIHPIPRTSSGYRGPPNRNTGRNSTYTALLLVLLALASISCFATAYYLFTTRWARGPYPSSHVHANQHPQVNSFNISKQHYTISQETKFLSYLPHSGFHNQRIEAENALVLAHILNRTLLLPPARLGKPIRYVKFDALSRFNSISSKYGLHHCSRVPTHVTLPLECFEYFDYTLVPWDWLVPVAEWNQPVLPRWDMTDRWIHDVLDIPASDIMTMAEASRYQFRFMDSLEDIAPNVRFEETVDIQSLASSDKRLIRLGTLFGTSRLGLAKTSNSIFRNHIRQKMAFTSPMLQRIADGIAVSLRKVYIGAHVRIGDGHFAKDTERNMRLIWWDLVCNTLGFGVAEALHLERDLLNSKHTTSPTGIILDTTEALTSPIRTPKTCRGQKHGPNRLRLNTPIFISTDAINPTNHPSLARFLATFPCIFFLSDFPSQVADLDNLVNEFDGVALKGFMLPFLDAMVVSRAERISVTTGSTFSRFIQDVLWRVNHGEEIVERGN